MALTLIVSTPAAAADSAQACRDGDRNACLVACKEGDAQACVKDLNMAGNEQDLASATRGCELGEPRGCLIAGRALATTQPPNPTVALPLFVRACEGGNRDGCLEAGMLQMSTGTANYPAAFVNLRRACLQGQTRGCALIGAMHHDGMGAPKSEERAAIAYKVSCEAGRVPDCIALSGMLKTPSDKLKALSIACFRMADKDACARVRELSAKGVNASNRLPDLIDPLLMEERKVADGTPKKKAGPLKKLPKSPPCEGVKLDTACEIGDLAVCQIGAEISERAGDHKLGYCAREKACSRGGGYACLQLARIVRGPTAITDDPKAALGWLEKGCRAGNIESCHLAIPLLSLPAVAVAEPDRTLRTAELLTLGCLLSDPSSCQTLAVLLTKGVADPATTKRARIAVGAWCEQNDGSVTCHGDKQLTKLDGLEAECLKGTASACIAGGQERVIEPLRLAKFLSKACGFGDCISCENWRGVEGVSAADAITSVSKAAQVCPAACKAAKVDDPEKPKLCERAVDALVRQGSAANETKALAIAEEVCKQGLGCDSLAARYIASPELSVADEQGLAAVLAERCAVETKASKSSTAPASCAAVSRRSFVKPARAACKEGKVESCLTLADALGRFATPALERACTLGSNLGCVKLWAELSGDLSADQARTAAAHQKATAACEAGDIEVCSQLARYLNYRSQKPEVSAELAEVSDRVMAVHILGCDSGDSAACMRGASFIEYMKTIDGPNRATILKEKACVLGLASVCATLADVPKTAPAAVAKWTNLACAGGHGLSCRRLLERRPKMSAAEWQEASASFSSGCKLKPDLCAIGADAGLTR